jgi:hypothetical protein
VLSSSRCIRGDFGVAGHFADLWQRFLAFKSPVRGVWLVSRVIGRLVLFFLAPLIVQRSDRAAARQEKGAENRGQKTGGTIWILDLSVSRPPPAGGLPRFFIF